jgi:dihydrofolate reductase
MKMRKIVVVEWMSLDGVVQAPGHPDEDRDGGFEHGGWHLRYFDDTSREWVVQGYAEAGGFLFGRRTYENLAAYWPHASEEEQVIAEPLNTKPKYIASRTLLGPLEWPNSTVLTGDVAQAVLELKQEDGRDLHVIGSPQLVQTLAEHHLVDQYRLMIDPLIIGRGKRLFGDSTAPKPLRLVESKVTSTGAILANYTTSEASI